MVSRRDRLKETGSFIGLAASHIALFGEEYPEGLLYLEQATLAIKVTKANQDECDYVREVAQKRGLKKIESHFKTEGKTQRFDYNQTIKAFEEQVDKLIEELL
ncbi:hypothetical protein [Desulfitobacterium sp. AusDCA]|uniref:hypothetical protein n=1 Tax=Desulfitobacterium sp. AusDCA TaxID=3240383 RepID=UPI003DA75C35